jgi:hypothetical protein
MPLCYVESIKTRHNVHRYLKKVTAQFSLYNQRFGVYVVEDNTSK